MFIKYLVNILFFVKYRNLLSFEYSVSFFNFVLLDKFLLLFFKYYFFRFESLNIKIVRCNLFSE